MKKYIISIIVGACIGSLLSFEIMIKTIMQSSSNFKLFSGALFGAFCGWIIVYNKK